MLEIQDVRKSFGGVPVLRGVSLSVDQGDVIAIIGPSGSGKTTLLRCLNYLERADSGTMVFDGQQLDMARVPKKEIARLRKKTAFVFQSYNLFANKNALQNVTEGLSVGRKMPRAQAEEIGRKALEKVGLSDRCGYYPSQLSGGAAAAGGHRPGHCGQAGDHLLRRAYLGPGPGADQGGPFRHAGPGRGGDDHAGGHS